SRGEESSPPCRCASEVRGETRQTSPYRSLGIAAGASEQLIGALMIAFKEAADCVPLRHQKFPGRPSGGRAEDANCALVGARDRMIDEWVVARLAYAELEDRAVARTHLKTLHPVEGIGRIAAAIDRAKHGADYVKTRSPVGSRIDEENPYQLADFYRDRVVRISFDDAVEHHEVRPFIHHAFAVTRHHPLVIGIAVELTLLDHHLVGLG